MTKFHLFIVTLGLFAHSSAQSSIPEIRTWPNKIVGGEPAKEKEIPYQLSMQIRGYDFCGGVIIAPQWALTAAHCFTPGYENPQVTVVAGTLNATETTANPTAKRLRVKKFIIHPGYDNVTQVNDIALLRFDQPFEFTDYIGAIPLPPTKHAATGNAMTSGWGLTSEGGNVSKVLLKVTVPIISDAKCREAYGSRIFDSMICAGFPNGEKDSCDGDSGGPLAAYDLGYRYLAGIVSWGDGCARPGYPGVYTEVSDFVDWIKSYL